MNRCDKLAIFLVLTPVLLTPAVLTLLPERIPVHWNAAGRIDGRGSPLTLLFHFQMLLLLLGIIYPIQVHFLRNKPHFIEIGKHLMVGIMGFLVLLMFSAFGLAWYASNHGTPSPEVAASLLGGLNLAFLAVLYYYTPRMFPNQNGNAMVTRQILLGAGLLFTFLVVAGSTRLFGGGAFRQERLFLGGIGIFFMFIGNVLPKLKSNPWSGFRVKWTLEDPEIWYRTHRFGGRLWLAGGAILVLSAFVLPPGTARIAAIADIAIISILPILYAWRLACRKRMAG